MGTSHDPTSKTGRKPAKKDQSLTSRITQAPSTLFKKLKSLNPSVLLGGSLVLVLLIVGIVAMAATGGEDDVASNVQTEEVAEIEKAAGMGAAITYAEGTLQTVDETGEWADTSAELQLSEGTRLRTVGAASRAIVTFDDGSALRLDANSEIELIGLSVERVEVNHAAGYTYNRVVPSESRAYIVTSQDAQYEALGTAFRTATTGDEQAVEVYHSSVNETVTNQKPDEGEKLTVKSNVNPSKDGQIEPLDIEALKEDQFVQWNKALDQQDENFKNQLGYLNDFDAPDVAITSHTEGQVVLLEPNATQGTITFSGNTERNASLTVLSKSQPGAQPVAIAVDEAGNFTSPVVSAPLGDSVFTFEVKDRVGNTNTKNIRITFQRKSAPVTPTGSIVLDGSIVSDNVELSWAFSGGLTTPDGVKVVYAKTTSPTYGSDSSSLVSSGTTTYSKKVTSFDSGETYYFRVCKYDASADTCANYSNQVSVDIP